MNEHDLNENLIDQMLKYVAEQEMEHPSEEYPSKEELEEEVLFTPDFEKRMDRLFKNVKRKEKGRRLSKTLLKVGMIVLAFLIISTSLILSVDALRVEVLNFFSKTDKESTTIRMEYNDVDYSAFSDQIHGLYLPNYVPQAYKLKSFVRSEQLCMLVFEDAEGKKITLQQITEEGSAGVDSEGAETEKLSINGETALYFKKNDIHTLLFLCDGNAFLLNAPISKDELVKISESMRYRS